jgi:hypothetical protein
MPLPICAPPRRQTSAATRTVRSGSGPRSRPLPSRRAISSSTSLAIRVCRVPTRSSTGPALGSCSTASRRMACGGARSARPAGGRAARAGARADVGASGDQGALPRLLRRLARRSAQVHGCALPVMAVPHGALAVESEKGADGGAAGRSSRAPVPTQSTPQPGRWPRLVDVAERGKLAARPVSTPSSKGAPLGTG